MRNSDSKQSQYEQELANLATLTIKSIEHQLMPLVGEYPDKTTELQDYLVTHLTDYVHDWNTLQIAMKFVEINSTAKEKLIAKSQQFVSENFDKFIKGAWDLHQVLVLIGGADNNAFRKSIEQQVMARGDYFLHPAWNVAGLVKLIRGEESFDAQYSDEAFDERSFVLQHFDTCIKNNTHLASVLSLWGQGPENRGFVKDVALKVKANPERFTMTEENRCCVPQLFVQSAPEFFEIKDNKINPQSFWKPVQVVNGITPTNQVTNKHETIATPSL